MINQQVVSNLKEKFLNYINLFQSDNPEFNQRYTVKKVHSLNVMHEIREIGKKVIDMEEKICLLEIIGLYHDLGRWEQYRKYQTFSDHGSENHSVIAIQVIKDNNLMDLLPKNIQEFIFKVILNHNVPFIPDDTEDEVKLFSMILRDADKLDILRIIRELDTSLDANNSDSTEIETIPLHIVEAFRNRRIVRVESVNSPIEFRLLRVSWIFDINYNITLKKINERKYIPFLMSKIPDSLEKREIINIINVYQRNRLSEKRLA